MRKIITFLLVLLALTTYANGRNEHEVVLHHGGGNGNELVYLEPPVVNYDEELNELTVYFGSSSTIDLECNDAIGPYYYIFKQFIDD